MNEAARSWLRALVGTLATMVGLWLIPDKGSGAQVLLLGPVVIAGGGAIAGSKWAWFTGPLGYWITVVAYEATDCAGCGEGGEETAPPALVWLALTVAVAALSEIGAGVGLLVRSALPSVRPVSLAVTAAGLGAVFLALVVWRANALAGDNGPVVLTRNGITYRAGDRMDIREARRTMAQFSGTPAAWLGPEALGYNLVEVALERRNPPNGEWNGDSLVLIYGACSPAQCPIPPSLYITTWCRVPPEFTAGSEAFEVLQGGAILQRRNTPRSDSGLVVWSGNVSITVHRQGLASGREEEILAALRTDDGQPLPPPAEATC